MNKVNREAIKQLLDTEDGAAISLYMPTHRFPISEHITEDKIRFKNLVRAGEDLLKEQGIEDGIIRQMTESLEAEIYDNLEFWQDSTEGLALFCTPASIESFRLPMECEERVVAGDSFDITPLLALASYDQPYYLLALATHKPVLYKGDMYGVERVDIELPESPEVALNIDESHAHSKTDRAGGYPGSKAHGQGDSKQAGQEEKLKFFRLLDDKIHTSSEVDGDLPFLLAGTDDEVSGYRDTSRLGHMLESVLGGNYTAIAEHEIHEKSWPLVSEELCDKVRDEQIEKLANLLGTGKASAGAEDIVSAAKEGRVDTLLVGMLAVTRDTVTDNEEPVMKLVFPEDYTSGGIDVSGRAVFDQGGKVVAVMGGILPDGASEAALYRY